MGTVSDSCAVWLVLLACLTCMEAVGDSLPKLILISMDGFRYNYLDRYTVDQTANFHYFINRGVKAKWINNVFPTVTYPSHYSLITGLYPESHGVVHNRFYDPNMDAYFDFSDKLDNYYSKWYDTGAEPIYVTNKNGGGGRRTGSLLWPAGLASVKGVSPDKLLYPLNSFDTVPNNERIDTLISWFTSETDPINLGLLYFLEPDHTGHHSGPDSPEMTEMITGELNDALGHLKQKLTDSGLIDTVNVILTADHGMVSRHDDKWVNIDKYVDPSWYHTGVKGNLNEIIMQVFPTQGNEEKFLQGIQNLTEEYLYVHLKNGSELRDLHFYNNDRIAPIVLEAKEGVILLTDETADIWHAKGMHGYDERKVSDVRPFFIAWGPAFKEGIVSEPFHQLDIYPLMCHILGIKPAPNNGSLENVAHILKKMPGLTETPVFTGTAISFLAVVGVAAMVASVFAICAVRQARLKPRLLLPSVNRSHGIKEIGQTSAQHSLLQNDTSEDEL